MNNEKSFDKIVKWVTLIASIVTILGFSVASIYNSIKDRFNDPLKGFSVIASYDVNTSQASLSGIDVLVKATTSFPAKRVTITAKSNEFQSEVLDMHGGLYEWEFKANFYIKGTYTITVTAYDSEDKSTSCEFTYVY